MHPSDPRRDTKEQVQKLHDAGLTPRQIADALRLSTQAVYRHLKTIKETSSPSADKVAS